MKNFFKFIGILILIPFIAIAIIITVLLLNYNDYGVTELGDKTFIIVNDNSLSPNYKKGDLVVVKKTEFDTINENDYIFFYEESREKKTIIINFGRVLSKTKVNDMETTFKLEGDVDFSSQYVIGSKDNSKVYKGMGSVLSVLESRWVFLIFIIIPMLFIFLFELYSFVLEVKKNMKEA